MRSQSVQSGAGTTNIALAKRFVWMIFIINQLHRRILRWARRRRRRDSLEPRKKIIKLPFGETCERLILWDGNGLNRKNREREESCEFCHGVWVVEWQAELGVVWIVVNRLYRRAYRMYIRRCSHDAHQTRLSDPCDANFSKWCIFGLYLTPQFIGSSCGWWGCTRSLRRP